MCCCGYVQVCAFGARGLVLRGCINTHRRRSRCADGRHTSLPDADLIRSAGPLPPHHGPPGFLSPTQIHGRTVAGRGLRGALPVATFHPGPGGADGSGTRAHRHMHDHTHPHTPTHTHHTHTYRHTPTSLSLSLSFALSPSLSFSLSCIPL